MLENLPPRTAKLLQEAGITTAVAALQAGRDGLISIKGIGESTADDILAAAQAEIAGEQALESGVSTPNETSDVVETDDSTDEADEETADADTDDLVDVDDEEAADDSADADDEDLPKPDTVVVRLNTLATAVLNGRVIYQNETRRVPFAHFEAAVREYPGAWLVRFHRGGEFKVA